MNNISDSFKKLAVGRNFADRYCITGQIGKGGMGVVYKAIPFDDPSHTVAIKVIQRAGKLNHDDLRRFQKEASLMSQLHHPNIVVFHELGLFNKEFNQASSDSGVVEGNKDGGYYIVMEIAQGANLKESLEDDSRKDLAYFFQVGMQVSSALDYTHGKNIIHRDIKPHNIIVGKGWGQKNKGISVKVLDFGVARLAEVVNYSQGENGHIIPVEDAAGTPIYMAPEQTPLMNAPVDHRVDLYSLGCVLYEILAGKPPFTASTREKLQKEHVFSEPELLTLIRPDIPTIVAKIVHKLLAKHPNDRYQTAFSLNADLIHVERLIRTEDSEGEKISLGLKDHFQSVSLQLKLIGRERDLGKIIENYQEVAKPKGRSRITLINGSAGIGKTRLMNEFKVYLQKNHIKFVSGSFSQHENSLEFNALANAFNEFLYNIVKNQPHEAEALRNRIFKICGDTMWSVAEIVPGLKPFLIEFDENGNKIIPEVNMDLLTPSEIFDRFAKAFSDFTRCLAPDHNPVVFLFDDLHWGDEKSLDLIDRFFSNANSLQFYLVISQRTGLQIKTKRFNEFINKFKKLKRRFVEVNLENLDNSSIEGILTNMLSSTKSVDSQLVNYFCEKTHGNPMQLVETLRHLVSRDLIYVNTLDNSLWSYNLEQIEKKVIKLDAIDLVLSKIFEYQEFDKEIISIAATIGLSFHFELLLLEGRQRSEDTMRIIERAENDKLIKCVEGEAELKHLGKAYMFTHKKARDDIYESLSKEKRRELHKKIGEKLRNSIERPSEKILFSLAHHFNSALKDESYENIDLSKRALKYNISSGETARKSNSLHTAERYYENAAKIMTFWQEKIANLGLRVRVIEILADLSGMQQKYSKTLEIYNILLKQKLSRNIHAHISCKASYFNLVEGNVNHSLILIEQGLNALGAKPKKNFGSEKALFIKNYVKDYIFVNNIEKTMYDILAYANKQGVKDEENLDRKYVAIRLCSIGVVVGASFSWKAAYMYHHAEFELAKKFQGSSTSLIRSVAEKSIILGSQNLYTTAYKYLDLSMDLAKRLKLNNLYGYTALLRAIFIDYTKNRHDDSDFNVKEALTNINPIKTQNEYLLALYFESFQALTKGNFEKITINLHIANEYVSDSNLLKLRIIALSMYSLLLQGERDAVVKLGENYTDTYEKCSFKRDEDIFLVLINCLLSFVKGERKKTVDYFKNIIKIYFSYPEKGVFMPFENDFILFKIFTFSSMFEKEMRIRLLNKTDCLNFIDKLKPTLFKKPERSIILLVLAQCIKKTKVNKHTNRYFDNAIKVSNTANDFLIQSFSYLWFGFHLNALGKKNNNYLQKAYVIASDYKIETIKNYLEKWNSNQKDGSKLDIIENKSKDNLQNKQDVCDSSSYLDVKHLEYLNNSLNSNSELNLAESLKIIKGAYKFDRAIFLINAALDQKTRILYPKLNEFDEQQIIDYVSPYTNIRSTLNLPDHDTPWNKQNFECNDLNLDVTSIEEDLSLTHTNVNDTFSLKQDTVKQEYEPSKDRYFEDTQLESLNSEVTMVSSPSELSTKKYFNSNKTIDDVSVSKLTVKRIKMNALVPLRTENGVGMLFFENIVSLERRKKSFVRNELDNIGVQLGYLIERKTKLALIQNVSSSFVPATFVLDDSSWLNIWSSGKLRSKRENTWYQGLNLSDDQYLLVYCSIEGNEELRDKFASMLWYQINILKFLKLSSGRDNFEFNELSEELLQFVKVFNEAKFLDKISFSFTLFNRVDELALSGHLGAARPMVLGSENIITPHNSVILHLASGRDLRYWEVAADISKPHLYLSSYNITDVGKNSVIPQKFMESHKDETGEQVDIKYLDSKLHEIIPKENLPRYYVAAFIRTKNETTDENLDIASGVKKGA